MVILELGGRLKTARLIFLRHSKEEIQELTCKWLLDVHSRPDPNKASRIRNSEISTEKILY